MDRETPMTFSEFLTQDFRVFSMRCTGSMYDMNAIGYNGPVGYLMYVVPDGDDPITLMDGRVVRELVMQYPLEAIAQWKDAS